MPLTGPDIPNRFATVASVDPTVNEDDINGYIVGDLWINTSNPSVPKGFLCMGNSTGAANWRFLGIVNNGFASYANMYRTSAQTTNIVASNVYQKANLTTTEDQLSNFTHTSNKLLYTGANTRPFHVNLSLMIGGALLGATFRCAVAINGAVNDAITAGVTLGLGAQMQVSANGMVVLSQNQYIEIYVKTSNGTNFVISEFTLSIF